ncbi:efflux RND transporter permease subunit [Motiliproteus sp. MSK22-1]|uniref:efflux RND transporter permease subunit n=1 Tax=Motiliproteus sp. MSK22-1 TaxID=1897630 RepID=UPI000976AE68|nr:efflux RND transporter permease subunit [Motiliproteus sp. MSK22-1]OMH32777.1 hypothetical protein BGP75_14730 [Motiliproteus sp. MSK22-1]
MINWFIRNPVAPNLMMLFILVAGVLSLSTMRSEALPKLPANSIGITTLYIGHNAEQVDEGLSYKIERALEGVEGIKNLHSRSEDGLSYVRVVRKDGFNLDKLALAVRQRIDAIEDWPTQAERAVIEQEVFSYPSLIVQISGGKSTETRQRILREVKRALLNQPGISKLKIWGEKSYRIALETDPYQLQSLGLTLTDIADAVNHSLVTSKAGILKTATGQLTLIADIQVYHARELADIVIKRLEGGGLVRLSDIVTLTDNFEEHDHRVLFNGQPAIGIEILASARSDLKQMSEQANKVIATLTPTLPEGVDIRIWSDLSIYIDDRLDLLKNNALQGMVLVFLLLALFLDLRLALWVAAGLPVAIAGTLFFMGPSFLDYTFNEITTFGFILVLGILVDDAVVVGESVYHSRTQSGGTALVATSRGVYRVVIPTVFGIATTIAAFFPLTQLSNESGKLFASFSWVVITALIMSLVESKLILPAHLAHTKIGKPGVIQRGVNRALDCFSESVYLPLLAWSLRHRYSVLLLFVSLLVASVAMVEKGLVRSVFFPEVPGNLISIEVNHHANTPLTLIRQNAAQLAAAADAINNAYVSGRQNDSTLVLSSAVLDPLIANVLTVMLEDKILIFAELSRSVADGPSITQVLNDWREKAGSLQGSWNLSFNATESAAPSVAKISLSHDSLRILAEARDKLVSDVQAQPDVLEVRDNLRTEIPQLRFRIRDEALQWGLTQADLARQLSAKFGGIEIKRLQRGADEVKVKLRFPRILRDSVADLNDIMIRDAQGKAYPLSAVAIMEMSYQRGEIIRKNGRPNAAVSIKVDKTQRSPEAVIGVLRNTTFQTLQADYPGLTISEAGELEQSRDAKQGLVKALLLSLLAIYALLAIPLKSYFQPVVIMAVIPFGFVGAVIGHAWLDLPISLLSMLGMMALSGVVVNDSLVLIAHYNQSNKSNIHRALLDSGRQRLRAIFLTTITTYAGLMPLMSETSEQAQYLIPAAVSLAYGELFATAITLVLVPVLLAIGADFSTLWQHKTTAETTSQ